MRAAQQSKSRNVSTRVRQSRESPDGGATVFGSESLLKESQLKWFLLKTWVGYIPLGQSASDGPSDEGLGRFVTLKPVGRIGVVACS